MILGTGAVWLKEYSTLLIMLDFSSEFFEKDGKRCGYLNFEDEEILEKLDDVTESMSAVTVSNPPPKVIAEINP